ncbi:hypothetical protein [Mesorhizobium sp. M1399]|uniref:hypothetical protein n=1 Tax=Mesorhizobium sp. M1399 TaxID=2957096 RepID=UPI003335FDB3
MTAWFRRACDRATNLGLSIGELTRRVHGQTEDKQMVELAMAMEETLRLELGGKPSDYEPTPYELATRAMILFNKKNPGRFA